VDPDGRQVSVINSTVFLYFLSIGWTPEQFTHLFGSLPGFDIAAGLSYGFTGWNAEGIWDVQYALAIAYTNPGVSTGSYGDSGGGDPLAEKKQYYSNVVGKDYRNIANRIQGKCATFIDAMQRKLFVSYSYMDPATFVISGLQSAPKNYAATGPGFTSGFGGGGWTVARTKGNTINLGELFYSSNPNPILTLIHEFFHLESTSGSRHKNLDHVGLLRIAEGAGYTTANRNADQAWKSLLNDQCGK
jgi:hypothetical protein